MEGHHAVAFYKRYKKIEGCKDNSIDRLLDFTDEAPSEEESFQNSDTNFKDSRNVYSTRRYHQTQTSLAQKYRMSLASCNNKDPQNTQIDQHRFERLSRIFNNCFTPKNVEESKFNKTEQIRLNTDPDTDREIIASVTKTKYCDNFNITFEEDAFINTLNKEKLLAISNIPLPCLPEHKSIRMPQLKRELKNKNRMKEMAISLANDLNISESEAYKQLFSNPEISCPQCPDSSNQIVNPFNTNSENETISSQISKSIQNQEQSKHLKRKSSKKKASKSKRISKSSTAKRSNLNKTVCDSTLASTQLRGIMQNPKYPTIVSNDNESLDQNDKELINPNANQIQVLSDQNKIEDAKPVNCFWSQINSNRENLLNNRVLFKEERARRVKRRSHSFNKNLELEEKIAYWNCRSLSHENRASKLCNPTYSLFSNVNNGNNGKEHL